MQDSSNEERRQDGERGGHQAEERDDQVVAALGAHGVERERRQVAAQKAAGMPMGYDVMSMLVYSKDTEDLIRKPMEFMGNLALLIIGGNDTTRNSMSGGLYALNLFPNEFVKLKQNPGLIPNMVSEIIRWQTPLAYINFP